MIRAMIFDCFGVLYSSGRSVLLERVATDRRTEFDDLYRQYDHGFIDEVDFRRAQLEMTGLEASELDDILRQTYVRNQPLLDYIETLRPRYKVSVLSNVGAPFFKTLFTEPEQAEWFDDVILSSEVGIVKPSPGIYELAAQRLDVTTDECFFVDDMEQNVTGAKAVGMQAVVFRDVATLRGDIEFL